LVGYLITEE
jgi:hypothetical protein